MLIKANDANGSFTDRTGRHSLGTGQAGSEIMKQHSMFLRIGCDLPSHFALDQLPCADDWMLLEGIEAPKFDTMIRLAGWHFAYAQESYCRTGVGLSRDEALNEALARALKGLRMHVNAAELEALEVYSYPVFHIATVSLQPRRVQQHTSLEMAQSDAT